MSWRRPPGLAQDRVDQLPRPSGIDGLEVTVLTVIADATGAGRFVYTPILPLMHAQAGLSPQLGSILATANYPVVVGGVGAALVSAALFGATFLGIAATVLAIGEHLRRPGAVAILTAGYSAGQVAGPLLVTPLLHHGYRQALLMAAVIIVLAAGTAGALRYRFPHHLGPLPRRMLTGARNTTTRS